MKYKIFIQFICGLALIVFSPSFKFTASESDIVAIDILLDPDKTMMDSAKVYNEMMQKNYSGAGSFALDALHKPHITVLQCFIKRADLKKVYKEVSKVVKKEQPTKEMLTTNGFYYIPLNGLGLAGITADTTANLLRFQAKLIAAIQPYCVHGTDDGFVQNENGSPIAPGTEQYVNSFIKDHSGAKFNPHVTIGLGTDAYLKELISKPYNKFSFKCSSVSVYQLGDFGTAKKKLWQSGIEKQ